MIEDSTETPLRTVTFVGIGPGDPKLLTVQALEALSEANAVLGECEIHRQFAQRYAPEAHYIDLEEQRIAGTLAAAHVSRLLVRTAKEHPKLVRLLPGDGADFGQCVDEARALRKAGLSFEAAPGLSLASVVPGYCGTPLVDTAVLNVIDYEKMQGEAKVDWNPLADPGRTLLLKGDVSDLIASAKALRNAGMAKETGVVVTVAATTSAQRTWDSTLETLPKDLRAAGKKKPLPTPILAIISPSAQKRADLSWFEQKPLFGWRILVPRTKEQSGKTVARLAEYGAVSEIVPTISVEPPRNPQPMEKAIKGLADGHYEWVGFTSVNAVRAVREKFTEFGLDARAFSGIKVAAVGGVTSQALVDWGITPDLVPSGEQSARGLLEEWPAYDSTMDPINGVLLPRADIATETLVEGLTDLGWEVDDVTAYRTVRASPPPAPIREAIKSGAFDAAVFTSSSTVRNLIGIAGKPHASTVIACIGPATAKTAEEHGLHVDVLASSASSSILVDELAEFGQRLQLEARAAGEPVLRPSQRRGASRRRIR